MGIKRITRWIGVLLLGAALGFPADASEAFVHDYRFQDGVQLKVHYQDAAQAEFASSVLDAAVSAYQTLTDFQGFSTPGFSFASPDYLYAYDPDKTIDIYLGTDGESEYEELGWKNKLFKDAPCFDTRKTGGTRYEALILLPADYAGFIRSWEKLNPSSLGGRNVHVDLRGTLIHEMTHVLMFYYNKNLDKSAENGEAAGKHLDWYVEGLARYFETFAGARHDFFSQGFKQTLPDKIRFSRGGSNYFMRYPDQAFTELRYENALFWRFIDMRFGMDKIEELSRRLRGRAGDFREMLEKVTGLRFDALLEEYALAVYLNDFGLKEDAGYLNSVATTKLEIERGAFYLLDGRGDRKTLGASASTDWIGRWEEASATFGQPSVAGDSTEAADVSAWATDYVELRLASGTGRVPGLRIRHLGSGQPLSVQVLAFTRGGSMIRREAFDVRRGAGEDAGLKELLETHYMGADDLDHAVLVITNTDPARTAPYELLLQD